ncbi:MAG: Uncharacterized protein F082_327 [bacterium F082]|nr:MAG: Uncharacterized protein F082_327 [bacterium F082]
MKKLFKLLALLSMAYAMTSCGTVGLLIHTAKIFNDNSSFSTNSMNDTIHFVVSNKNQMLFKAEINGKSDTVMYDTGVNSFALLMYTPSTKPEGMKFYSHRVSGADKRSKIKVTTLPVTIKTNMVVSEGLGFANLGPEPPICQREEALSAHNIIGFQGLNLVRYMIDFTDNQMYEIPDSLSIDTTEFIPIKCKYYRNVLWVYPRINGMEYECIFDTGNGAAAFLLQDEQRVDNPGEKDYVFEGSFGQAIGGHTDKRTFVYANHENLSLVGVDKDTEVLYVKSVSNNNMGLKAISKYDWIISSMGGNLKMYARPHTTDVVKPFEAPAYRVSTADGTLKILNRLIDGNEKYKVGDQIISVNGEKITEENICHYYELLTENKDWSGFEIEVK